MSLWDEWPHLFPFSKTQQKLWAESAPQHSPFLQPEPAVWHAGAWAPLWVSLATEVSELRQPTILVRQQMILNSLSQAKFYMTELPNWGPHFLHYLNTYHWFLQSALLRITESYGWVEGNGGPERLWVKSEFRAGQESAELAQDEWTRPPGFLRHTTSLFLLLYSLLSVDSVWTTGGGREGSETGLVDGERTFQMHNKKYIDAHCLVLF